MRSPFVPLRLCVDQPSSQVNRVDFHCLCCCQVTVIVAESDAFHFVFPDGLAAPIVDHVFVESGGGASVHVPIRPLVLGEIPVSVKAMTATASDSVRRTVTVKVKVKYVNNSGQRRRRELEIEVEVVFVDV